jgi:hypothetical protein
LQVSGPLQKLPSSGQSALLEQQGEMGLFMHEPGPQSLSAAQETPLFGPPTQVPAVHVGNSHTSSVQLFPSLQSAFVTQQ